MMDRWTGFSVKFVIDKLLIVTGWPRTVQGIHPSPKGVGAGTSRVVEFLTVATGMLVGGAALGSGIVD